MTMAATPFTDDAYNKHTKIGSGTLVGNWFEERAIRDVSGEGRTVPQRHIPRRGLLHDFMKGPSITEPPRQDDTFERIHGPKAFQKHVPFSKTIGAGEVDLTGTKPVSDMLQAEGRIPRLGPRESAARAQRLEFAQWQVAEEDERRLVLQNKRCLETTTGSVFVKPDETEISRPQHLRKSYKLELMHGPAPDRSRALRNAGLEVQTRVHYSNADAVTHHRMGLADPSGRNGLKVSAAGGHSVFGRHSQFSKPIEECLLGREKDHEMNKLYASLQGTDPLRSLEGAEPLARAFSSVPALTSLKAAVKRRVYDQWGPCGYVTLRQQLHNCSDSEGFISKDAAMAVLRDKLCLCALDVDDAVLDVYLDQLITMKKHELKMKTLMTSLRPNLPQAARRLTIQTFEALGPLGGAARLGTWLSHLCDSELRGAVICAFGGDKNNSVDNFLISEHIFTELISDLAPFTEIETLLVS